MSENKIIKCPFCERKLIARFILEKKTMSRFYAYCKLCKCSIMKSVRRAEEELKEEKELASDVRLKEKLDYGSYLCEWMLRARRCQE